jgi:hypothetical protein
VSLHSLPVLFSLQALVLSYHTVPVEGRVREGDAIRVVYILYIF